MNDIMKVAKSCEDSRILLKDVVTQMKMKQKNEDINFVLGRKHIFCI